MKKTPQMTVVSFEKACDEFVCPIKHRMFDDSRSSFLAAATSCWRTNQNTPTGKTDDNV